MTASDQPLTASIPLNDVSSPQGRAALFEDDSQSVFRPWAIVIFGMLFAFLLASFPARNSDIWLHLAAGRSLLHGRLPAELVTSILPETRAHKFALYDILLYGLYSAVGGAGLVLLKAILVAGIALILMHVGRVDSDYWTPAVCTALAMLAMSIRLLLQPATVSCFLLALMVMVIRDRGKSAADRPVSLRPRWELLPLFIVWAAMDNWIVVGLAVLGLSWIGEVVDEPSFAGKRLQALLYRIIGIVLLAIIPLLNPLRPIHFELPSELSLGHLASPFRRSYFFSIGTTPAGLAFYLLLGAGLLSFGLNLRSWRWRRFLPWLGLAALCAVQARAIPFFAVVAGPVLAWNIRDIIARRPDRHNPAWHYWEAARQPLTVIAGAALLICAWPGWLQFPPFEPRRWAIDLSPALESAAMSVNAWRADGRIASDTRWLHLSPDTASAFAWLSPKEASVFDRRLSAAIRGEEQLPDFSGRMRAAGIDRVVVYDSDRSRLMAALVNLKADPVHWPLLEFVGDVAIFGWRDPEKRGTADSRFTMELDFDRLAFQPAEHMKAPARPPERGPEPRHWWDAFRQRNPPRTIDDGESLLHLIHAEVLRQSAPSRHLTTWVFAESVALMGASFAWSGPGGIFDARLRLSLLQPQPLDGSDPASNLSIPDRAGLIMQQGTTVQWDDTRPALLYLAIRAARRAIAANPEDAQAYLVLGESYIRLLKSTRERVWSLNLRELVQLRWIQASAALNQAVLLNPNLAQAHLKLSELYGEMKYLDLTLKHLRIYLDLIHRTARASGNLTEEFRAQEAQYQKEIDRLSKTLENQLKSFLTNSAKSKLLDRVNLAVRLGLAEKARDMLLESDISAFGAEGAARELELLLNTGRCRNARDWVSPEQEPILGASSFHWIRAQAQAACGNYVEAESECNRLVRSIANEDTAKGPIRLQQVLAMVIGQAVLAEHPGITTAPTIALRAYLRLNFRDQVNNLVRQMKQEADATVLRGLLALEEGEILEAKYAFRTALAIWKDENAPPGTVGLDFNGRQAAQECLIWLK